MRPLPADWHIRGHLVESVNDSNRLQIGSWLRRLARRAILGDSARVNVYCRATELLEAEVHDELVALQPDLGLCFGFNAVATTVWRELESPRSFAEIKDRLLGAYEVDEQRCSSELGELLDRMVAHGLVRVSAD